MSLRRDSFLFCFFIFWAQGGWASPPVSPDPLTNVLSLMDKATREMRTLSFTFRQTAVVLVTGEIQKVQGVARFKKPNKFWIEQKSPRRQTMVSDGETMWFYNPSQNQVLMDRWENVSRSGGFPKGLLPFQADADELRQQYEITWLRKDNQGKGAVLELTPRIAGPWPYKFRLWIDLDSGIPYRTEVESQSIRTSTEIHGAKVNPPLSDRNFRFEPPSGAEVLGASAPEKKEGVP